MNLKAGFHWNKHPCLVFKLYGPSVYQLMSKNRHRPFPEYIVRDLTVQMCTAMQCMCFVLFFRLFEFGFECDLYVILPLK